MISDQALLVVLRSSRRVALAGDLVRATIALAVVIAIIVLLGYNARLGRFMFTRLHMNDFGKFYYSAQMFLQGQDMYGPSPATLIPVGRIETRQFWNMNPPHFHLLILPLALLEPPRAILAWLLLSLLAFVVSARLIARALNWRWTPTRTLWVAFGVLLCSATGANVLTGQVTFLLMLPLTMAWMAARSGHWNRTAWLLGIAASIKPFLAIFWIYFLVARRSRPLLLMTSAAVMCLLPGLLVFGVGSYQRWLEVVSTVDWWWAPMNGSLSGFLGRGLSESPLFTPIANLPDVVRLWASALALVAGVLSVSLVVRDRSSLAPDRVFAGLLLTAQLVSPLGWIYYLWFAAGLVLALRQSAQTRPSRLRNALVMLAFPGLVCPLIAMGIWRNSFATLTIGSIYGWSTLLLWAAVLVDLRVDPDNAARNPPPRVEGTRQGRQMHGSCAPGTHQVRQGLALVHRPAAQRT